MDLGGFYKKSLEERLEIVRKLGDLDEKDMDFLKRTGALDIDMANRMIENVIGTFELPFGIATNFVINGKEYLIPMVIEEASIVAAASKGAKMAKPLGFKASADDSIMKSMVQLVSVPDMEGGIKNIQDKKRGLIEMVRDPKSSIVKLGGGVFDIVPRVIETKRGKMLICDIMCDCKDAMGANTVNTAAEKITPELEELTGGKRRLMIISNLADKRLARAEACWRKEDLGEELIEGILDAYEFAENDPYRCATQNKGIMNGIDAVCIATGNDFRALEAGAHAYASRNGRYESLTKYEKNENGDLVGRIELPLAVGIVGGSTKINPVAKVGLKLLGVNSAKELAAIVASVGLAQNFATLRAQVAEGLQAGHMKLHAKNLAISAGASGDVIDRAAERMISEGDVSMSRAKEIIQELGGWNGKDKSNNI